MRTHEKDGEVKIPKWMLKLPVKTLTKLSDVTFIVGRLLSKPRKRHIPKNTNIKFYI